ncbi:MAG: DUF1287 domain-containing protein [Candidatus Methylacidiphilales bacterium]
MINNRGGWRWIICLVAFGIACSSTSASPLVEAARSQIGVTVIYDPAYVSLTYPGGDVPEDRGVCTDVVIRAFREAFGWDLQHELHQDIKSHFFAYPQRWGLKRPDKNIDHRRVPNLQTFFDRKGYALPRGTSLKDLLPGDLVTCTVPPHLPHIMIISDRKNAQGLPLVIHNIGNGTREEDRLDVYPITGLYRITLTNRE